MLVTTSRKPVMGSRRLAKAMCAFFPGCEYSGRGKESFQGMCEKAFQSGHEILCSVYEKHGSPSLLSLARVIPSRDGVDFEYLPESIVVRNVKFHPALKQALGVKKHGPALFEGDSSSQVMGLFGVSGEGDDKSQFKVSCSSGRMGFYFKGSPCIEFEYRISRHPQDAVQ